LNKKFINRGGESVTKKISKMMSQQFFYQARASIVTRLRSKWTDNLNIFLHI